MFQQSPITKYFVQNEQQTALKPPFEIYLHEIGTVKRHCIIYTYFIPGTKTAVYVGQTYQTLKSRDRNHLWSKSAGFDKVYTSKSKYTLKIIAEKTFEQHIHSEEDDRHFARECVNWLDDNEIFYINQYNTYDGSHGFNRTKGGQGLSCFIRMQQAALKESLRKFEQVYIPLMKKFLREERAKIPGTDTPSLLMVKTQKEPIIGVLIHHIRSGHTAVPASVKLWMLAHGHADNYFDGLFKQQYIPLMKKFLREERAKIPGTRTPSLVMVSQREPIIGVLIDSIRTGGNTAVPASVKLWMLAHGHADNKSEGLFKQQYMPLINKILLEDRFKLPVTRTPSLTMVNIKKEPIIGTLIDDIRSGTTAVPASVKSWFDDKGMLWHTSNVAKHVLRRMGIRRRIATLEFALDDTISLDPENNEDLKNRLEQLRCFLLEEKLPGRRFNMAAKKYTATRETFVAKYRRDLEELKERRA